MAEIYPLQLPNGSNTDWEFRKILGKSHKIQELTSYDIALEMLKKYGTQINQMWKPQSLKKLRKNLHELRSKNVRTFIYIEKNDMFILLHSFLKTTQKTQQKDINPLKNLGCTGILR